MKRKVIENQGKNQVTTLQTLKYTTQQLTIKDATLEDQLDKEDKKEIEKIFKSRKIVKKRRAILKSLGLITFNTLNYLLYVFVPKLYKS